MLQVDNVVVRVPRTGGEMACGICFSGGPERLPQWTMSIAMCVTWRSIDTWSISTFSDGGSSLCWWSVCADCTVDQGTVEVPSIFTILVLFDVNISAVEQISISKCCKYIFLFLYLVVSFPMCMLDVSIFSNFRFKVCSHASQWRVQGNIDLDSPVWTCLRDFLS